MNTRILILPLLWLTVSCSDRSPKSECSPVCVETARATTVEVASCREFPFIAKPLRTSTLSFRVSGPVERFDLYAGSYFRAGELIAEIDPRDFRLRYEQAEAAWRQARSDYERVAALYEKDNLPASSYEVARAACVAAETARDAALNALNDTRLVAPFDGYVGEVFIERHQDVKNSQPVVTFADISSLRIEIYVTQEIAMQADSFDEVTIEFDHRPGESFRARVVECARSTTPNNLSYLLTALLPNPTACSRRECQDACCSICPERLIKGWLFLARPSVTPPGRATASGRWIRSRDVSHGATLPSVNSFPKIGSPCAGV